MVKQETEDILDSVEVISFLPQTECVSDILNSVMKDLNQRKIKNGNR